MFTIHRASSDVDWLQATALLFDYVEWIRCSMAIDPLATDPRLRNDLEAAAEQYATDDAALYLASWHAVAIGGVAIRTQPDGTAELKRMYVRPIARGHGIADRLIDTAVAHATERRCHSVWLETVRGAMDPAIAVYRRNGFAETSARQGALPLDGAILMERFLGGDPRGRGTANGCCPIPRP